MLIIIDTHPYWFWMTLGGLLLIIEMIGASGYLLWSGIASLMVGFMRCMLFLSWETQGTLFSFLTLVNLFLWHHWIKKQQKIQHPSVLNQRLSKMNNISLTLKEDLINGIGYVRIGDSSWRVQADSDLPAGTKVKVIGLDGITLRIASHQEKLISI